MKYFNFFGLTLNLYKLLIAGLTVIDTVMLLDMQPLQAETFKPQRDCTATLAFSQQKIAAQRNVSTMLHVNNITYFYPDHPQKRPYSYVLKLDGTGSASIMNSPQLMNSIAREIITNCDSVGLIIFTTYFSSYQPWIGHFIGLTSDGKIERFGCVENTPDGDLKWGRRFCDD